MGKHEWRKKEKEYYLPKGKPELINIPAFNFACIQGAGNPNDSFFSEYITVLYSISYAIKMNLKKASSKPDQYMDYTVYPLEGIWDLNEEAKKRKEAGFSKDDLVFKLMIRQPEFVTGDFFNDMLELTRKKKPHTLLDKLRFERIEDGDCIQMMHTGPYDSEPESFKLMENFASSKGLTRMSKKHREIYISDFRKVAAEKLKTVLRFQLKR